MRRALVGCLALSLGAPPIGVFLMLRRMSLMGDAMSHAILPGAAIGFLLAGLSLLAMSLGGFVAGLRRGARRGACRARDDPARGCEPCRLLSRVARPRRADRLGAAAAISTCCMCCSARCWRSTTRRSSCSASIATVSLIVLAAIYRPLVLECFDPQFLRSVSSLSSPTHFTFLVLVVLNLVAGFQALGTLMAVGIMLLPAVAARFWAEDIVGHDRRGDG